jgi:hypothetical protein
MHSFRIDRIGWRKPNPAPPYRPYVIIKPSNPAPTAQHGLSTREQRQIAEKAQRERSAVARNTPSATWADDILAGRLVRCESKPTDPIRTIRYGEVAYPIDHPGVFRCCVCGHVTPPTLASSAPDVCWECYASHVNRERDTEKDRERQERREASAVTTQALVDQLRQLGITSENLADLKAARFGPISISDFAEQTGRHERTVHASIARAKRILREHGLSVPPRPTPVTILRFDPQRDMPDLVQTKTGAYRLTFGGFEDSNYNHVLRSEQQYSGSPRQARDKSSVSQANRPSRSLKTNTDKRRSAALELNELIRLVRRAS